MKAKHRILAAGMAAAMTLSLAACGGSASTAEPTAILTMAMSILLISGGIDLSIGNIMVVCGVVMYVVLDNGLPTFIAVLAGLVTGAACGLLNGAIIAKSKCIPLVITLGTSKMFYGIALTVSGGRIMNFGGAFNGLKTKYFEIFSPMLLVLLSVLT